MSEQEKETPQVEEVVKQQPKIDNDTGKIKVKKRPKSKTLTPEVTKVNVSDPVEESATEVIKIDTSVKTEEVASEPLKTEEVLEEVKEQPLKAETPSQPKLPEAVEKLVSFMQETGGDISDYTKLNQDYEAWDSDDLVRAYYKDTKPHLNEEEILFMMEDNFKYEEGYDDDKEIRRKKLALKEQVAQAKHHLESVKSKYYEEIKMGSRLSEEQQNALKFFNESKERQEVNSQAQQMFVQKTKEVFNDDFKGFEYKVGDKRYRYNINDASSVKDTQSDINNFVRKFLNEDNVMENASGYHKGLFTAMNSDAIANHFYEQGKADALKQSIAKSKNINMDPRQSHSAEVQSGFRVKALNADSNDFKFKIKKKH